ncbi:hypothetical protein FIBSPDRAFT_855466 [Athelia psychrophila]|uniref:Uncharacterized protein n=1 Tax=Athelia psychrophila TaxID=1759441 RepID=A0A166P8J5_9AGAM|nr:hypothetical protein FIBSPDRAFT_855466 [Fibularhizoctonia sp. CBS 109695]
MPRIRLHVDSKAGVITFPPQCMIFFQPHVQDILPSHLCHLVKYLFRIGVAS